MSWLPGDREHGRPERAQEGRRRRVLLGPSAVRQVAGRDDEFGCRALDQRREAVLDSRAPPGPRSGGPRCEGGGWEGAESRGTLMAMVDEPTEIFDDLYVGLRAGGAMRKKRRGEPLTMEEEEAIGRWQSLSGRARRRRSAPSRSGRSPSASRSAGSCSAAGARPDLVSAPDVVQRPADEGDDRERDPDPRLIHGRERQSGGEEDRELDRELCRPREARSSPWVRRRAPTPVTAAGAAIASSHCVTPDDVAKPQYAVAASADSSSRKRTRRFASSQDRLTTTLPSASCAENKTAGTPPRGHISVVAREGEAETAGNPNRPTKPRPCGHRRDEEVYLEMRRHTAPCSRGRSSGRAAVALGVVA